MDKSSDQILDNSVMQIQRKFEKKASNIVLCSESFHKIELLNKLIKTSQVPVIVIDMDLVYTGYVESGMIKKNDKVKIFHPDNYQSWSKELSEVINIVSKEKFLILIDSINGAYNIFDDYDSVRFINSCIMLLASIAKKGEDVKDEQNSSIVITAIGRRKESGEWVLSPGGKQIINFGNMGIFLLKKIENDFVVELLDGKKIDNKKPDQESK